MEEDNERYEPSIGELAKMLGQFTINAKEVLNGIATAIGTFATKLAEVASSEFMKGFSNVLLEIGKDIQEARENPNSVFNYSKYEKSLDDMHWAWPYEIEASVIFDILQNVNSEKEFDDKMLELFTEEKICRMICVSKNHIAKHHKVLLNQVAKGIKNKSYALVNNALMSIIDNSLSVYIVDKGCVARKNIFKPIIEHYDNCILDEIGEFIFDLCMLSNNIDFIFDKVDFTKKIELRTNKIARRHAALHGFRYSNKRVDTIMLLNTLVALMKIKPYLRFFENGLKHKRNKGFEFTEEMKNKIMREKAENIIHVMLELDDTVTHSSVLKCYEEAELFVDYDKDKGRYVSKILQSMKQKGGLMRVHKNDKWCWIKCATDDAMMTES